MLLGAAWRYSESSVILCNLLSKLSLNATNHLQLPPAVSQQVQNLWQKNDRVLEFVRGQRLARIAAELMGVSSLDTCPS